MLRKLLLSTALVGILGAALAFAPGASSDVVAATASDAVPVVNQMLSHSVASSTNG